MVGFIKGKSAIHLAQVYGEKKRNFVGRHFWARGYFVSTVGRDPRTDTGYIKKQEAEDTRLEHVAVSCRLEVAPANWGRVRDPTAALTGSQLKPRLCRGILTREGWPSGLRHRS